MASEMTTTFLDKYVKSGDPAHHGPLKPIYFGKPIKKTPGGIGIVRKQDHFFVCIPSEFAQHVAIAFKANKDVDAAIKECLYGKDEDGVYRCALWDITEDNEHIVTQPKEENFIDGGSLGPLLGENWITYKMFLTWNPLYTIVVRGMDGHIWVGFYDYERNEIGKVRVHKDI